VTTIQYLLPATGFSPPSGDEAAKLMRIVDAARPELTLLKSVELSEFRYAMRASGLMFRRETPDTSHAFSFFIDSANAMLTERWGAPGVSGTALLGAIWAHADVVWRRADRSIGQLLEVGLDLHVGRQCENRWRDLIEGKANLLAPVAARSEFMHRAGKEHPRATFWTHGESGLRQLQSNEPLWGRR
jgi:hypothetical protein